MEYENKNKNTDSIAEQRAEVERRLGVSVEEVFERNRQHVAKGENNDSELLHLYLPREEQSPADILLRRQVDENGHQVITVSYSGEGVFDNHFIYDTGNPLGQQFLSARLDEHSGQIIPREKPATTEQNTNPFDYTADSELVFWGNVWLGNFENAVAEKPPSKGLRRLLGKLSIGRAGS